VLLGLKISRYKSGDENRIACLLVECFETFSSFGMNGEKWLEYQDIDPGLDLSEAFVARFNRKTIGHVQMVLRNLKIGDSNFVRLACIGNVCVLPEYRQKDVAKELLDHVHNHVSNMGLPLAALLVQPGSRAWSLYSKQGYRDVYLLEDVTSDLEKMKRMIKPLNESKKILIRDYLSGDEKTMLEIYNSASNSLVGIQKRDLDYWKRRYVSVLTYDGFFYEPFDPEKILVAEENGIVCGYCFISILKGKGYIREIISMPGKEYAIDYLTAKALEKFASKDVREVVFLSMHASLHQTFRNIVKSNFVRISSHDQFMIKIIRFSALIKSLEPEILDRLRDLRPLNIGLRIDGNSSAIKVEPERIALDSSLEGCNPTFSMNEGLFLKLLFGAASADAVIDEKSVAIIPNNEYSKTIFRSLFPRKSFYLSPGDVW
jgi:ribosomal protein S18 acetylase RimI-like enzyme